MAYTEEIFQKIQKLQQQRELWIQEHGEELLIRFTERFQISYGEHEIIKTLPKYKEAIRIANEDADIYITENNFNKNDSAGRTITKIDLRKEMLK